MISQLPSGLIQGKVILIKPGKKPKWKAGFRIELHSRTLIDGSIKVHGSWIIRGKREVGKSRYAGHIPAKNLINYLSKERLENGRKKTKEN